MLLCKEYLKEYTLNTFTHLYFWGSLIFKNFVNGILTS